MDKEQESDRTEKITFRVSPAEKQWLEDRRQGVKRSHYIRTLLFDYPRPRPRSTIPQINRDTYIELSRIGNNLNQQTKALNQALANGRNPALSKAYLKQLISLRELVQQIQAQLSR